MTSSVSLGSCSSFDSVWPQEGHLYSCERILTFPPSTGLPIFALPHFPQSMRRAHAIILPLSPVVLLVKYTHSFIDAGCFKAMTHLLYRLISFVLFFGML